jgi:glycine cleavage system H protein
MDPFSYHNLFETKGIEYLVIILFLGLLIPFAILMNRKVNLRQKLTVLGERLSAAVFSIPQGIFHAPNHTWTHLERAGLAEVGLDSFVATMIPFRYLQINVKPGEIIRKGDVMATIEHEGKQLRILSPVTGSIMEVNPLYKETSSSYQGDPYGKEWLLKMKPSSWKEDTYSYIFAENATGWLHDERQRFRDFLAQRSENQLHGSLQPILQDGGEIRENSLAELSSATWCDFQQEFLDPERTY